MGDDQSALQFSFSTKTRSYCNLLVDDWTSVWATLISGSLNASPVLSRRVINGAFIIVTKVFRPKASVPQNYYFQLSL